MCKCLPVFREVFYCANVCIFLSVYPSTDDELEIKGHSVNVVKFTIAFFLLIIFASVSVLSQVYLKW